MDIIKTRITRIYKFLTSLSDYTFTSEEFNLIFSSAITCATRMTAEFLVKHKIPLEEYQLISIVATSLAFGAFSLQEELGFAVGVTQWLLLIYKDEISEDMKELFIHYQVLMLSDESYNLCQEERSNY